MNSTTGTLAASGSTEPARSPRGHFWRNDAWLYLLLVGLVAMTWLIARMGIVSPESDTGYWIGVAGGSCMLALFTYPLRKHWRFMHRFGPSKPWFVAHMVLGVSGPTLILVHSGWRIGSINAGVALFSMLTVAASGVVGRLLYVRLHSDLHGHRLNLAALRGPRGADGAPAARLRFAPEVVERLTAFESRMLDEKLLRRAAPLHALFRVPWTRWRVEHECRSELKIRVLAVGKSEGYGRTRTRRLLETARRVLHEELMAMERIAQFSAMERLFSWWHVAHVPIVYLMLISAVAHVVAVHIY